MWPNVSVSFQSNVFRTEKSVIAHTLISSVSFNIVWMYKTADYHITVCHCMWVICHPLQHVSPWWQLDNDPKVNLTGHQQPHSPLSHCTPSIVKPRSIAHSYLHKFKLTATQWIRWRITTVLCWMLTPLYLKQVILLWTEDASMYMQCCSQLSVCTSLSPVALSKQIDYITPRGEVFTPNCFLFQPQGATLEEQSFFGFFSPDKTIQK